MNDLVRWRWGMRESMQPGGFTGLENEACPYCEAGLVHPAGLDSLTFPRLFLGEVALCTNTFTDFCCCVYLLNWSRTQLGHDYAGEPPPIREPHMCRIIAVQNNQDAN